MRIGELSGITGVSTRALRYYEEQGLLRSERRSNGYREYDPGAADTVTFIQDLYAAGLPSAVIRDVLPCGRGERPSGDCSDLLSRVREIRDELAERERRMAKRRQTLDDYLAGVRSPRGRARS